MVFLKYIIFVHYLSYATLVGGGGDSGAVTELGFPHVSTKTWAYLGVFGFFRKKFVYKKYPPPPSLCQITS